MEKYKVFKFVKGKDTLRKLGYKEEFQYNYTDATGTLITYDRVQELIKEGKFQKKDWANAPTWWEKDITLPFEHPLVQSIYKVMCSKEFVDDNNRHIEMLTAKFDKEWGEIVNNVLKHNYAYKKYIKYMEKTNAHINKMVEDGVPHEDIVKWCEEERKRINKEWTPNQVKNLTKCRNWLWDKELFTKYCSIPELTGDDMNIDDVKLVECAFVSDKYVDACLNKAYEKGEIIKYEVINDEQGGVRYEPELDEEDIADLTTFHLVIDLEGDEEGYSGSDGSKGRGNDSTKKIVFVANKKEGAMYCNAQILRELLNDEIECNAVRESEIKANKPSVNVGEEANWVDISKEDSEELEEDEELEGEANDAHWVDNNSNSDSVCDDMPNWVERKNVC